MRRIFNLRVVLTFMICLLVGCLVTIGVKAQDQGTVVQPTELELLKLTSANQDVELVNKNMQLMQMQSQLLQQQYNQTQAQLVAVQQKKDNLIAEIKAAHKWGDDVTYDPAQGWQRHAKPTPSPATKK